MRRSIGLAYPHLNAPFNETSKKRSALLYPFKFTYPHLNGTVQSDFRKAVATPLNSLIPFTYMTSKIAVCPPFKFSYPTFECTVQMRLQKKRSALLIHSNLLIRI